MFPSKILMIQLGVLAALGNALTIFPTPSLSQWSLNGLTASENFTQILCSGPDALDWCMAKQYSKCSVSEHQQGVVCSARVGTRFQQSATRAIVSSSLLSFLTRLTTLAHQKISPRSLICVTEPGRGGQYFVKLECRQILTFSY